MMLYRSLPQLKKRFAQRRSGKEIGWGDKGFISHKKSNRAWLPVPCSRASGAVMHIAAFSGKPERAISRRTDIKITAPAHKPAQYLMCVIWPQLLLSGYLIPLNKEFGL